MNPLLHNCLFFQRKSTKNSLYLAESCLHPNAAQNSIVRDFAACKSNIKANKNVNAHFNNIKNTHDQHRLRHRPLGVKGLLAADW